MLYSPNCHNATSKGNVVGHEGWGALVVHLAGCVRSVLPPLRTALTLAKVSAEYNQSILK